MLGVLSSDCEVENCNQYLPAMKTVMAHWQKNPEAQRNSVLFNPNLF